MLKEEWKGLFKNKILLVVVAAILIIPTIYSTLFLASMWDPYGKIENLPVAVVNKDESVTYNEKELSVGADLVDNLKDNNSLAFNFVDADTARKGLENGTYYMVITIPKDFSANAASVMDNEPQRMELDYETNPGTNYIASKLSETALKEIKSNIAAEVTKTYTTTVFDQINEIGTSMDKAADATNDMQDGEDKLIKGNDKITKNLKLLSDSTLTFKDGSEKITNGMKDYINGVGKVDNGLTDLKDGVSKLSVKAADGAQQLSKGASALSNGITGYTDGVQNVKTGVDKLISNNTALNNGISKLVNGIDDLKNGSSTLYSGLNAMTSSIGESLSEEKQAQMTKLTGGMNSLNQGIQQMNQGIQSMNMDKITAAAAAMNSIDASTMKSAGSNMKSSIMNLGQTAKGIGTSAGTICSSTTIKAIQSSDVLTSDQKAAILSAIKNLGSDASSMETEVKSAASSAAALNNQLESIENVVSGSSDLSTSLKSLSSIAALKTSMQAIADNSNVVLTNGQTALTSLSSGLLTVKNSLDEQVIPGMKQLDTGLGTVQASMKSKDGLQAGIKSYTAGTAELKKGLNLLTKNNHTLVSGATELASGSNKLSTNLTSGINKLVDGTDELKNGTSKLVSNNGKLLDGVSKLSDGAVKISEGSLKLKKGSQKIGNGLSDLKDGTEKLSTKLADGSEEIKDNKASKSNIKMFSKPVTVKETKITKVSNNGHAMAAYMMSVALWVGCIAFCIMYPISRYHGNFKSGLAWWCSKASVIYPMAILMALIMLFALNRFCGFKPVELGGTILVACLGSVAFMSMMYFFNAFVGKVGSFLMLIYMVIQLAGSAGTYPIEISDGFVAKIHPFLPFSYTVDAFRSTISGGKDITASVYVLIGIIVIFTILTILLFTYRGKNIANGKRTLNDWLEEHGVA